MDKNPKTEVIIEQIHDFCDAAISAGVGTGKIEYAGGLVAYIKLNGLRKTLDELHEEIDRLKGKQ